MTLQTFRLQYPEFSPATDSVVQAKLDDAATVVSAAAYGASYDLAHGLYAAHLLWTSEHGTSLRAEGGDKKPKSRYLESFRSVSKRKVPRVIVT